LLTTEANTLDNGVNPLKNEATSRKTQRFSITKISWLMLFREIIAVYSEKHTEPINKLCEQNVKLLNIKADGKNCKHFVGYYYISKEPIVSIFRVEHAGDRFLRNLGNYLQDYTAS
jgi:iron-sulfur cluster repair protein YtfE (RIC family)